jgi:hypothetical protein
MAAMTSKYNRVLAAKFSPRNGCFIADGQLIFVKPLSNISIRDTVSHHFSSVTDPEITSQFGWVTEISPFTTEDFLESLSSTVEINHELIEHTNHMLDAVARHSINTPMAVDYFRRGLNTQSMALSVHKVFFR